MFADDFPIVEEVHQSYKEWKEHPVTRVFFRILEDDLYTFEDEVLSASLDSIYSYVTMMKRRGQIEYIQNILGDLLLDMLVSQKEARDGVQTDEESNDEPRFH